MSNGKGSARRPTAIPPDEEARRWEATFSAQQRQTACYKQCKQCERMVEFSPIDPILMKYAVVHFLHCIGGNDLRLCGMKSHPPEPPDETL